MRPVPSLFTMIDQPEAKPIIAPWDYARMRRESAGLSIAQAARPYWHRPEHREDVERNTARLEQPGFCLTDNFMGCDMSRAFPFNIDVYVQLSTAPPDLHPRLCMRCAWDQWTSQPDLNGDDVTWSEDNPDICTRCEQIEARRAAR